MPLLSGQLPYQYDTGGGAFTVGYHYGPNPIGISGILIEQAQFVITSETRKYSSADDTLPIFYKYITQDETGINLINLGDNYEPLSTGGNLSSPDFPANASFVDHILDTRSALQTLFGLYSLESNYSSLEHKKSWLSNLYRSSPSGGNGNWLRREPSETGLIDYTSLDVLGGSGVLFDVDVGEIMFNPYPSLMAYGTVSMHNRTALNTTQDFNVMAYPAFPSFQKTNGNIITLNGREPNTSRNYPDYNIQHIQSGYISIAGTSLLPTTSFYLSRNGDIVDVTSQDFTYQVQGLRTNYYVTKSLSNARVFVQPTAQSSGVYRISAVNHYSNNPATAIESGIVSLWPRLSHYWPNDTTGIGSTTTLANLGYHIFNDCIWMTDTYSTSSVTNNKPSGLAILSPFTGHRMWLRNADETSVTVNGDNRNWSTGVGIERLLQNKIYRLHPVLEPAFTSTWARLRIFEYNDDLTLINNFLSTSTAPAPNENSFPVGTTSTSVNVWDYWYDLTNSIFWVTPNTFLGYDIFKFDSSWDFLGKYFIQNLPTYSPQGPQDIRGFSANGNAYMFYAYDDGTATYYTGIRKLTETLVDPSPFTTGALDYGILFAEDPKFINDTTSGYNNDEIILDVIVVPNTATHVIPGIYAIVTKSRTVTSTRDVFLFRIEEGVSSWEVKATTRLDQDVNIALLRELLYMPY